ncbi:helix-turn-helix domain-containing protein [Paraburkholderia phymatum]|uniref:helix-turn-helix domain-containing protein n=1 Tax=Paraburkholderia phymatum TaxID=148447 RepID=UPI003179FB72
MEKGVPIRSVSRALAVLKLINRHGAITLMEVARESRLAYPTACRIVQTLMVEGMVEFEPSRKRYRATRLVETLSMGYRDHDNLIEKGRPHIVALTKLVNWPITITTRVGQSVMVRDNTYEMSSLSFSRYYRGYTLPILECAAGHVSIAYSEDEVREVLLRGLQEVGAKSLALDMFLSGRLTARIKTDGFVLNDRTVHTDNPGKTSSISVPIMERAREVAELTLSYFSTAMNPAEATRRYVDLVKQTASDITQAASAEDQALEVA